MRSKHKQLDKHAFTQAAQPNMFGDSFWSLRI